MREWDLRELRDAVDGLDTQIIHLLGRRMERVEQIQSLKRLTGMACRETEREAAILDRVHSAARREGLDPEWVTRLFREIFKFSERFAREEVTP